ncbi:MAG: DUF1045 domain-containing protein [Burkholderiaceae bacterium]
MKTRSAPEPGIDGSPACREPAMHRYAVYFLPADGHPLAEAGARWLGRHPDGSPVARRPPGLGGDIWRDLVDEPARYGFHATLVAPFRLARGSSHADLLAGARAFASRWAPIEVPPLAVSALGDFLALRPGPVGGGHRGSLPTIDQLAAGAVRAFDRLRRALEPDDIARRRTAMLDPVEDALMLRWGYPYVLSRWRLHFTLTRKLAPAMSRPIARIADTHFGPALREPLRCEDLCLFAEPMPGDPLRLVARIPLTGQGAGPDVTAQ